MFWPAEELLVSREELCCLELTEVCAYVLMCVNTKYLFVMEPVPCMALTGRDFCLFWSRCPVWHWQAGIFVCFEAGALYGTDRPGFLFVLEPVSCMALTGRDFCLFWSRCPVWHWQAGIFATAVFIRGMRHYASEHSGTTHKTQMSVCWSNSHSN